MSDFAEEMSEKHGAEAHARLGHAVPPTPESVSLTVTGPNPDYSPQAEIEMWKGLLDKAEAKMVAALIERNRDAAILDALPEILAFCRKSGNVIGLVNWLRRQSDV